MPQEVQRDLGKHEAQIEQLERRMSNLEDKMDEVLLILHQAQGSWKMMVAIGGVAAVIGGLLREIFTYFNK